VDIQAMKRTQSRLNHSKKILNPFLYPSSPKRAADCLLAKTYSSHRSFTKLISSIPLRLNIADARIAEDAKITDDAMADDEAKIADDAKLAEDPKINLFLPVLLQQGIFHF
jgi:hypothetical protein